MGGTQVEIDGGLFNTAGGTQITFDSSPALGVNCPNQTKCFATSPSFNGSDTLDVLATVGGFTSARQPPITNFTYTPGPVCTSALSCPVAFGFPDLVVQCSAPENFYIMAGTPNQTFVGSGMSFAFDVNDVPQLGAACPPTGGSCAFFSLYEASPTYCGSLPPPPPNFCQECKATGGICTTGPGGKKFCVHE